MLGDLTPNWAGSGDYNLIINGLADALYLCVSRVFGNEMRLIGLGGAEAGAFVVFTTTNLHPPVVWEPILTNQFDSLGAVGYTNILDPSEPERYFLLEEH